MAHEQDTDGILGPVNKLPDDGGFHTVPPVSFVLEAKDQGEKIIRIKAMGLQAAEEFTLHRRGEYMLLGCHAQQAVKVLGIQSGQWHKFACLSRFSNRLPEVSFIGSEKRARPGLLHLLFLALDVGSDSFQLR